MTYTSASSSITNTASPVRRTIYPGSAGFVYEDNGAGPVLQFVATPEGRALYTPDNPDPTKHWAYEYHLRDHLGNLRFAFRERVTNGDDGWDINTSGRMSSKKMQAFFLPVSFPPHGYRR
jgi:hypothetical protein